MSRDHYPAAEAEALRRMLAIHPGSLKDGRQVIADALTEGEQAWDALKSLAPLLQGAIEHEGDLAEIGRAVRDRVLAYCRSCPRFEDYVGQELADATARDTEDEERDALLDA